jgi:GMP synthase PP-ATPase subunit
MRNGWSFFSRRGMRGHFVFLLGSIREVKEYPESKGLKVHHEKKEAFGYQIIEPLIQLPKDGARVIGKALGLP